MRQRLLDLRRSSPALSVGTSKKAAGKRVQVTVRVTDAGDPVAGARVTGLPGGTKTTDAKGAVTVTLPPGRALSITGSKPGWASWARIPC